MPHHLARYPIRYNHKMPNKKYYKSAYAACGRKGGCNVSNSYD